MKMSSLRGSWWFLVTTVTSTGYIFPSVRHRHILATATAAVPRVHPPAVDEEGFPASVAGLRLSDRPAFRPGRLWSGHAMVADNHPRVEELERSVGIVNSDAGIFRTGRPGSGHAMVDHEHPRLAELESHAVGIVNSGRGESQWIGEDIFLHPRIEEERRPRTRTNTRSLSLQELPEEVLQRVAAFSVNLGPGDVRATRIGHGTSTLLERLDVLGILAAFADDAWAIVRDKYDTWSWALQEARDVNELHEDGILWRLRPRRPSLEDIFPADGSPGWDENDLPSLEDYHYERRVFRRLCDATSSLLLRSTVGEDGWPSPAPRSGTLPGRLRNPQLRWSLRLRSGAQVRIRPWGAHRFEDYWYWTGDFLDETESVGVEPEPDFLRWSSYLEGYANAERTGEVVEFLPPGTIKGLPPGPGDHQEEGGYLVRFPLPALPWTIELENYAGPSPFWQVGEPVPEQTTDGDEQVPGGGWRLTPERATRLPDGQDVLLLEVPQSRLYVDVAAHTETDDARRQTNANPFESTVTVI